MGNGSADTEATAGLDQEITYGLTTGADLVLPETEAKNPDSKAVETFYKRRELQVREYLERLKLKFLHVLINDEAVNIYERDGFDRPRLYCDRIRKFIVAALDSSDEDLQIFRIEVPDIAAVGAGDLDKRPKDSVVAHWIILFHQYLLDRLKTENCVEATCAGVEISLPRDLESTDIGYVLKATITAKRNRAFD